IVTCRLTDRPLRPLFPKGMRNEIQVIGTVLSADQENDPDILTITGASAALSISDIPFDGPIAGTRIGYVDGQFVVNPTFAQLNDSEIDLVVAGGRDAVVMVEAAATEVPESLMLEAIRIGQEVNAELCSLQEEMVAKVGKPKAEVDTKTLPDEVLSAVEEFVSSRNWDLISGAKDERSEGLTERRKELVEALGETYPEKELKSALSEMTKAAVRSRILSEGRRPDDRKTDEVRALSGEVGLQA
ncbi:MAG: polyribonucleotide nucleotidyltransferase, partial [Nitrospinae bacterium]|nr:polyribonucleotide nucleotidyltransferase [Nitrospinota bacterium]